jgi:hypothetical protein
VEGTDVNKKGDKNSGGAGGHALAGYEYQIDVSVWLALDLVLTNKLTTKIVLEPSSQEDAEADLEEFEPGRIANTAQVSDYRLIVQAKLRSGDPWSVAGVKALLQHGKNRESAATRLRKKENRYLLVTNAALSGKTKGFRVRRAGAWPKPADMAASIAKMLPPGAAGRVAIVANQDEERLETDIKRLLIESFRVPAARWKECLAALRDEARIRIRGGGAGRWTREEVGRVIRAHDGYLASSPELEQYVYPTNWAEIKSAVNLRHGILILGQSGTGKTLATKKLFEELRTTVPGLSRVPITLGPQQLRDDATAPPVLFEIEDPWGRYDFDPKSRPWNDGLAQAFAHASHDKMVVATSRRDVAQSSGAIEGVSPWVVTLESEHYGASQRQQLYETRIGALPRNLQPAAIDAEQTVLAKLGTPLEIQKFFDALPQLDPAGLRHPPSFIGEAIRRAHQNAIEQTVVDQVEGRQDIRAAAILWGMLKVNDRLSLNLLREIEEGLADRESKLDRGVSPLVNAFVAARNLRLSEAAVSYYHPRVESGIATALERDALVARRTLQVLIEVFVSLDGPTEGWGTSSATRLIAAASSKTSIHPKASQSAQVKIDAWLRSELAKGGKTFGATLRLASVAGSSDSNVAEVARFLLHRPDQTWPLMEQWGAPEHDEAWYARMQADSATRPILATFITGVLPNEREYHPDFVSAVERLGGDLSSAFLDAAMQIVHYGVVYTSDAIAKGALKNLDDFEPVLDAATTVLTPTASERLKLEETRLAIVNDEYSEGYAEYVEQDDDGYTAREFIDGFVCRSRLARGWQSLIEHKHREWFLWYWLRALAKDKAPDPAEVAGAFSATHGGEHEDDLWYVVRKAWNAMYLEPLLDRILTGHKVQSVRVAALACLLTNAPGELAGLCWTLLGQANHNRLAEIAIELGELRDRQSRSDDQYFVERGLAALPAEFVEICESVVALVSKQIPMLSDAARRAISELAGASEEVRLFRIRLDKNTSIPVSEDVRWLLANASDRDTAVEALEGAIRHQMSAEIESALTHRFARVVALALSFVAAPLAPPLPADLLALADAKGSRVRLALVTVLAEKPHELHLPTLLRLAHDEWSNASQQFQEPENYPIAQGAIEAIGKLATLSEATYDGLYDLAINTSDYDLRYKVFLLLADATPHMQQKLLDLAVGPGRRDVSRAAVGALLARAKKVAPAVIAGIHSDAIATLAEPVAVKLAMLLAWKGELDVIQTVAKALATNDRRRVFLLLIVRILAARDRALAETVAAMLPPNHKAIPWAFGEEVHVTDDLLDDLGDPLSVEEVLPYLTH